MFARIIFFILLIVNVILAYRVVWSDSGIITYLRLKEEYNKLNEQNEKVKLENIKLSRDIRRLKSDREYLADIIRKKMHYSKKNEIVYIFTTTTREDSPAKRVNMLGTGEQR